MIHPYGWSGSISGGTYNRKKNHRKISKVFNVCFWSLKALQLVNICDDVQYLNNLNVKKYSQSKRLFLTFKSAIFDRKLIFASERFGQYSHFWQKSFISPRKRLFWLIFYQSFLKKMAFLTDIQIKRAIFE